MDKTFRSFLAPDLTIIDDLCLHRLGHRQRIARCEPFIARRYTDSPLVARDRDAEERLGLFDAPILGNSALDRLANVNDQIMIDSETYSQRLSPHKGLLTWKEVPDPPTSHRCVTLYRPRT
ncbi:MAG: hypothetical protein OXS30_07565 [Chloroflexota bacterium]|nr:hypothetical protein [Chloroflexota bacterium]